MALLRLPAPGLRGTFAKAYALLTLLVSKIGWDELLRSRSTVFVMEEEYRLHKTSGSVDMNGIADNAPTKDIRSSGDTETSSTPSEIPTIRISSESTRGPGKPKQAAENTIERPEIAQASQDPRADGEEVVSAFSNKRLCERWLGMLFSATHKLSLTPADNLFLCVLASMS